MHRAAAVRASAPSSTPPRGPRSRASTSPTSPTTGRVDTGAVRIAFDRPEVRNAFRPHTVDELYRALDHARMTPGRRRVLLTGNGPSAKDGGWAFCSGGDQRIRGRSGYQYAEGETADTVDQARVKAAGGRLHILEVQRLIRTMPKVVIAVVNGWAAGGGHSPARRLRPDDRQPRARPVQADRRRRRLVRRRLRLGVPGQDGRAEERPRDLLPRPHLLRRGHAADGRGQHRRRPRRPRERGAAGGPRDQRQEPDRAADAEVRVQPHRRRA